MVNCSMCSRGEKGWVKGGRRVHVKLAMQEKKQKKERGCWGVERTRRGGYVRVHSALTESRICWQGKKKLGLCTLANE